jgi:hypothetical protein
LEVETSNGVYLRRIRPATVLPAGIPSGPAAEDATRNAAAYWGLPDFVFRPVQRFRGSATREVGDAILLVGTVGASVQVKARHSHTPNDIRERSWLDKSIRKAAKQAAGTIRSITSGLDCALVNERGRRVLIKGREMTWLPITVLDHPGVEGYVPPGPSVVILRRDWEFLFEQLKSTYAVMEYLRRISGRDPVPLGHEPIRYYELAAADAATPPSTLDPRLNRPGLFSQSAPLLPQAPAGHGNERNHLIVRSVLEDLATAQFNDSVEHADVLDILAAIDAVPVAYRAELGKMWQSWLYEVTQAPSSEITWRFRSHIWPDRPYLLFGAAPRHDALIQEAFGGYVSLRNQQLLEAMPERRKIMTVGVLLTPRRGGRPWDTTAVATRGEQNLGVDQRALLMALWGELGESVRYPDLAAVP